MATVLKNILNFTGLVVGVPAVTPHLLNVNGTPKVPRIGGANVSGFTVTATATNVIVTRLPSATGGTVRVYVEYWHSIEDVEPAGGIPSGYFPLFFAGDGGDGGGGDPAVIFDDAVAGTNVNIRSNRAANQSPIDNTQAGITNLGSQTHTDNPAATGASGAYSTIAGGNDNTVSGYGAAAVGFGNTVTSPGGVAVGALNVVVGDWSFAAGEQCTAGPGANSTALGSLCTTTNGGVAIGSVCVSTGAEAITFGRDCTASGAHAIAIGLDCVASSAEAIALGNACTASGAQSAAIGNACTTTGVASLAVGLQNVTTGDYSAAVGRDNVTGLVATASLVSGRQGSATRPTQRLLASGCFDVPGDAQTWEVVYRGQTFGSGPGESTILQFDNTELVCQDNRAYTIAVELVAYGLVGGLPVMQSIRQMFAVRCEAATVTIAASGTAEQIGDAAAASWALGTLFGGDTFSLTFDTGATTSAVRVAARTKITEVFVPAP